MPAASLQCPLCAGVLQVDTSWGGGQVTCPHCQGLLTLPDERTLAELALAELASGEIDAPPVEALPPEAPPGISPPPLDAPPTFADQLPPSAPSGIFAGQPPSPVLPQPLRTASQPREAAEKAESRRLTPEEKAHRRFVKNVILFVFCLGILLAVLYFLAR